MSRHVLVYGGCGNLGRTIVSKFISNKWMVTSVDFKDNSDATNNVILTSTPTFEEAGDYVMEKVRSFPKFDAVINVAGGWAGGSVNDKDIYNNVILMHNQSVFSSVIAAKLAASYLNEGGLLTLTGAAAATNGTPDMVAYGMAKAAVHHLVKSLALPKSELPNDSHVNAILPVILDTPMNRKFMPEADTTTWTPMDEVAQKLFSWASDKSLRPAKNGSLVKIVTVDGKTNFSEVADLYQI